jgi:hypothetical protein
MGWSYTHVALIGPTQQHVAAVLRGRQAAVSPTVNGFTLVADKEFESHDEERISELAAELSRTLSCPGIVISEFDDDVFSYRLIDTGVVIDEYNSEPDYFDFAGEHIPPRGPLGGDAERLCSALQRIDARERVDRILHEQDAYLEAPDRHRKLVEALGMPVFSVGFDYRALQNDELPEGLEGPDVIFSETEPG